MSALSWPSDQLLNALQMLTSSLSLEGLSPVQTVIRQTLITIIQSLLEQQKTMRTDQRESLSQAQELLQQSLSWEGITTEELGTQQTLIAILHSLGEVEMRTGQGKEQEPEELEQKEDGWLEEEWKPDEWKPDEWRSDLGWGESPARPPAPKMTQ